MKPLDAFKEIIGEPVVTTDRFHEVLSVLDPDRSEDELLAREYMEYLLHLPQTAERVPQARFEEGRQDMANGLISTVTIDEILELPPSDSDLSNSTWRELAQKVVRNRLGGDPSWRLVAIERHQMLMQFLRKS